MFLDKYILLDWPAVETDLRFLDSRSFFRVSLVVARWTQSPQVFLIPYEFRMRPNRLDVINSRSALAA